MTQIHATDEDLMAGRPTSSLIQDERDIDSKDGLKKKEPEFVETKLVPQTMLTKSNRRGRITLKKGLTNKSGAEAGQSMLMQSMSTIKKSMLKG